MLLALSELRHISAAFTPYDVQLAVSLCEALASLSRTQTKAMKHVWKAPSLIGMSNNSTLIQD